MQAIPSQVKQMKTTSLATKGSLRLIIADDRDPAREGLKAFLAALDDEFHCKGNGLRRMPICVVGEARDGLQAVQLVDTLHPDVVIMDVRMPGIDGIQATKMIKKRWPGVAIIILSFYGIYREEAKQAGADAFFLKGCDPDELLNCLIEIGLQLHE